VSFLRGSEIERGRWQFKPAPFRGVPTLSDKKAPHLFQCGASPVDEL